MGKRATQCWPKANRAKPPKPDLATRLAYMAVGSEMPITGSIQHARAVAAIVSRNSGLQFTFDGTARRPVITRRG